MSHRHITCAILASAALAAASCNSIDDAFCEGPGCDLSGDEWTRLQALSLDRLPRPVDPSNAKFEDDAAVALGHKLYFEPRMSGVASYVDTLGRTVPRARAARGVRMCISCATCHDPSRAGSDFSSEPRHISVGAGYYDVNAQQTLDSAHYKLLYWNGRSDSLWSQALAVTESGVSMNSTRLQVAWVIADHYRDEWAKVFPDEPLQLSAANRPALETIEPRFDVKDPTKNNPKFGQCKVAEGAACAAPCREVKDNNVTYCWPRFPLTGKPGERAYDHLVAEDKAHVDRVFVRFAKAIAAYEGRLRRPSAPFDDFLREGPNRSHISAGAQRGARLFVGKASCIDCHSGPLMSDNGFHNIGVAQIGEGVPQVADCTAGSRCDCTTGDRCLPWGAYDGISKLQKPVAGSDFRRTSIHSDQQELDPFYTRYYTLSLANEPRLKGAWRTPSLRDVALTPPYMHSGAIRTLEEVVTHYDWGGAPSGAGSRAAQMKPLGLTASERNDLVEFLRTLTSPALPPELAARPTLPPGDCLP